MPKYIF